MSFKSDIVKIILNNEKEEIILAEPIIQHTFFSEESISYYFPIVQWKAYTNDYCFFQFDSIENQDAGNLSNRLKSPYLPPNLILRISKSNDDKNNQVYAEIEITSMNAYNMQKNSEVGIAPIEPLGAPINLTKIRQREQEDARFDLEHFKIVPLSNSSGNNIPFNNLKYAYDTFSRTLNMLMQNII